MIIVDNRFPIIYLSSSVLLGKNISMFNDIAKISGKITNFFYKNLFKFQLVNSGKWQLIINSHKSKLESEPRKPLRIPVKKYPMN